MTLTEARIAMNEAEVHARAVDYQFGHASAQAAWADYRAARGWYVLTAMAEVRWDPITGRERAV